MCVPLGVRVTFLKLDSAAWGEKSPLLSNRQKFFPNNLYRSEIMGNHG